jgi:hypothetical protein
MGESVPTIRLSLGLELFCIKYIKEPMLSTVLIGAFFPTIYMSSSYRRILHKRYKGAYVFSGDNDILTKTILICLCSSMLVRASCPYNPGVHIELLFQKLYIVKTGPKSQNTISDGKTS